MAAAKGIVVSEDPSAHIPAELLALPAHYRGTVGSVLISHGLVRDRCVAPLEAAREGRAEKRGAGGAGRHGGRGGKGREPRERSTGHGARRPCRACSSPRVLPVCPPRLAARSAARRYTLLMRPRGTALGGWAQGGPAGARHCAAELGPAGGGVRAQGRRCLLLGPVAGGEPAERGPRRARADPGRVCAPAELRERPQHRHGRDHGPRPGQAAWQGRPRRRGHCRHGPLRRRRGQGHQRGRRQPRALREPPRQAHARVQRVRARLYV